MPEYLPPVVSRLEGNIDDLLAKVEAAKAAIKSIGSTSADVGVNLNAADLKAKAQAAASTIGRVQIPASLNLNDVSAVRTGLETIAADVGGLAARTRDAADAADHAEKSYRLWGTGIRLSGTAMHALISGLIDLAAVGVPALIATASWLTVWSGGAVQVAQHMDALYTVTSSTNKMFGDTMSSALGLSGALSKAMTAADPQVYQALGGALNLVKSQSGSLIKSGTQLGQVFDGFIAKFDVEMSRSGSSSLLSGMVSDATELGQLLGNLVHDLLSVASAAPGAAELLLKLADGATKLAGLALDNPLGRLFTTGFLAAHEFNVWGSVAVSTMSKLGLASGELSGSFYGLGTRAIGIFRSMIGVVPAAISKIGLSIGGLGGKLPVFGDQVTEAGARMANFGKDAEEAIGGLSGWQVALTVGAAVGLGILIDKLVTAKTATQQFIASVNSGVASSSSLNVFNSIASAMGKVNKQLEDAPATITQWRSKYTGAVQVVNPAIQQLTQEQASLTTQFTDTMGRANQLSGMFHTSFIGALTLASQAGIKLQNNLTGPQWIQALQQVRNLVSGYQAMGQGMGVVGSDMNAMGIQAGLAASKVNSLNSAWDQFMGNLTGGTSALASFTEGLENIGGVSQDTAGHLSSLSNTTTLSSKQFADALKSFSGNGAAAWQNMGQMITQGNSLIDWMRTAGAEGALSGSQFRSGVLDMVSSLTKFASASPTAQHQLLGLAQQADSNIKSWPQLTKAIDSGKFSLKKLAPLIEDATKKMSNMGQVATTLGTDIQNNFISQMATAILKSGTMTTDVNKLVGAVKQFGANSPQAHQALENISSMLQQAGIHGKQLKGILQGLQQYINGMHGKTLNLNVETSYDKATGGKGTGSAGAGYRGYAAGTPSARKGWAMVGERGPELMYMKGGERVVPNYLVRGYADGAGMGGEVHLHVELDGKEIFTNVKQRTQQYNQHNGNRRRGGRVPGVMVPR